MLLSLAALALMGLFLAFPQVTAQGAAQGLELAARQLIPALFPFFVVNQLLSGSGGSQRLAFFLRPFSRLCGVKSSRGPLVLLLSWCGGYAVAAQSIALGRRQGALTRREGCLLLLAGAGASPGFTVGAVGGMLGSQVLGLFLYLACLGGNLAAALCFRPFLKEEPRTEEEPPPPAAPVSLTAALSRACYSCLEVTGVVVFFRVVWALAGALFHWEGKTAALAGSLLEVTSGCALFGELSSLYGCCLALSLLSGSVFLQIKGLLEGRCPLWPLLLSRPLHLGVSLGLLRGLLRLFPQASQVYSSLVPRLVLTTRTAPDLAFWIFLLCCVVLHSLRRDQN